MGYGLRLKEILEEKNMSVRELAKMANINYNTLYAIIRRDASVRYDHAIRIASILDIDVSEICKINPYDVGETLPNLLNEYGGLLTQVNKNSYEKYRLDSVLNLFDYKDFPKIDQLLCNFFTLSDEGRQELFNYISFLNVNKKDSAREEIKLNLVGVQFFPIGKKALGKSQSFNSALYKNDNFNKDEYLKHLSE